eukprot:TRINITY_DN5725_c0_g1_i1.p1 TRINITY_DN5725_c0_g1~~TRINITY_DN5725_c0_g1_i1.p1  ORF type:complete len:188 (-),score=40.24 TRINITY_DN5725_c0_g1_i1:41-604(-)
MGDGGSSRCCKIFGIVCAILIVLAIAIGLTVFFLFPRIPETQVGQATTSKPAYTRNPTGNPPIKDLYVNVTVPVNITNNNYVDINILSIDLKITHEGDPIGVSDTGYTNIPKRQLTKFDILAKIYVSGEDPNSAAYMARLLIDAQQNNGKVKVLIKGPVTVKYLTVTTSFDINQTTEVDMSGIPTSR